jgi:hypothetical protein
VSASTTKIAKETVVVEHHDGKPHITVDGGGTFHHYDPCGHHDVVEMFGADAPQADARKEASSQHSGPPNVNTDAFRSGWDGIWSTPTRGGTPS